MKSFRFLSVLVVCLLCSESSATMRLYTLGVRAGDAPPITVINDELQPFTWTFPGTVRSQIALGLFYNITHSSFTLSLDNPVPVGSISSDNFTVGNFTGTWSQGGKVGPAIGASFDVPLEAFGTFGPDPNAEEGNFSVGIGSTEFIVNHTFHGIGGVGDELVQMTASASASNAAVPEPSQYLMFGLVAAICLGIRRLRRK